jgi:hypothetical protein
MSYVLCQTAKCIVASAADFISGGLAPTPPAVIEGTVDEVMDSQRLHDTAIAETPAIVEMLNAWTFEARTTWLMNNFQTDERYADAWNIAQRARHHSPLSFPLKIEGFWRRRAAQTW